jgi:hypothetical protein
MMAELKAIKASVKPTDTLLVVDAMTGQEAANLVKVSGSVDESGYCRARVCQQAAVNMRILILTCLSTCLLRKAA